MPRTTTSNVVDGTSSNVYIPATKILNKVVREIGGTEPVYDDASWYPSSVEYQVSFNIPSKNQAGDMVQIALCGVSPGETNKDDACEAVARDAILLLQHDHDMNMLDYNWLFIEKLSARCEVLLKKYIEGQEILEFIKNKSYMVIDGIHFASDIFINKANEIDNLAKVQGFNPIMATIFRECAQKLQFIAQSSINDVQLKLGFTEFAQKATRLKLGRPFALYDQIPMKVGALKINSGLKLILHEVASKAGYHSSTMKIDDYFDGGYVGSVHLVHTETECNVYTPHVIVGKKLKDKYEAKSSVMHHAVEFLQGTHNLTIMDPNFYWKKELEKIEVAMRKELPELASGASRIEQSAHFAIVDIHKTADKYDGSISGKDKYIKRLLNAICIDLVHHLQPTTELIETAWKNCQVS